MRSLSRQFIQSGYRTRRRDTLFCAAKRKYPKKRRLDCCYFLRSSVLPLVGSIGYLHKFLIGVETIKKHRRGVWDCESILFIPLFSKEGLGEIWSIKKLLLNINNLWLNKIPLDPPFTQEEAKVIILSQSRMHTPNIESLYVIELIL